jgi:hypothetical protein
MVEEPAFAVTVPPQVFEASPTTVMLAGILSIQDALVNGNEFGLNMVMRRTDVPPDEIELGEKLLFISAGRDN